MKTLKKLIATMVGISLSSMAIAAKPIIHDVDYSILEAQHAKAWSEDNKAVDAKLAEFRKKNGGKPPNIIYILVDDMGFGDMGIPELNAIRGYETPAINECSPRVCALRACTRSRPVHRPGSPS